MGRYAAHRIADLPLSIKRMIDCMIDVVDQKRPFDLCDRSAAMAIVEASPESKQLVLHLRNPAPHCARVESETKKPDNTYTTIPACGSFPDT